MTEEKFIFDISPMTPEEIKAYEQKNLGLAMMQHQCTAEEYLLACKENREPRPIWETNPEIADHKPG